MFDQLVLLTLAVYLSGVSYVLVSCRRTALRLCFAGR